QNPAPRPSFRGALLVFVSLAGGVAGLTLLYLGMRSVMEIGGACAEGGPFVPLRPCPKGVPLVMIGGIWGGIIFFGLYAWQAFKNGAPSLVLLAWPALFLSLGWIFLEFGINPPGDGSGLVWGWLVCAFFFVLMGGLPLIPMLKPIARAFSGRAPETEPPQSASDLLRSQLQKVSRFTGPIQETAPTQPTPTSPTSDSGLVDELERLDALRRSGGLSESEFAAAKRKLLTDQGGT
ncbi:MAG: hypothetical protein QOH90_974, partial [Actinomycetota bacterium]|nr:hypothetical protein [Actinomycetota bacterium]